MKIQRNEINLDLLPSDRLHLDGEPYFYCGHTDAGLLFIRDDESSSREVSFDELYQLLLEPGRFRLESEFLKRGGRR